MLELREIKHQYRKTTALRGINGHFERGVVGLLGPNGAGKSTLFSLLTTSTRVQHGEILWKGQSVSGTNIDDLRQNLGYLPQKFGYPPSFSPIQLLEYIAWLRKTPKTRVRKDIDNALAAVHMQSKAKTPMRKLSGGMVRRVGIAQAIMGTPEFVVFDEPTTGLDPEQRTIFRKILRQLATTSCVLLATHLTEDVQHGCGRVVVMKHGQFISDSRVADLERLGSNHSEGDTALERGYYAVLEHGSAVKETVR